MLSPLLLALIQRFIGRPRKRLSRVVFACLLACAVSAPALGSVPGAAAQGGVRVKVEVTGVEGEVRDNVRQHLTLYRLEKGGNLVTRRSLRRLLKTAPEEATAALQAFGYYAATLEITTASADEHVVTLSILPGSVALFRSVDIQFLGAGRDEKSLHRLVRESAMQPGEPVSHAHYTALKSDLQKRAYDLGYLDASFSQQVLRAYPDAAAVDVTLILDTGQRYRFGDIALVQDILDADYAARFVRQRAGDPFLSKELLALQQALSASGYFSHVSLDVATDEASDYHIPVSVQTAPRKAARYGASLGYGTDTGARIGLSTEFRRVNRRGHRFAGELQFSGINATLASRYTIPIGDVRHESLELTGNAESEQVNDTDSEAYRLATTLNQLRWGGRRRLSLALVYEDWNFGDGPASDATLLIPSMDFTVKNTDDPFFSRTGYSYTVQLRGAAEGVLSDVDFLQASLFGRYVYPVSERSRLLLRAEYGTTVTDAFDNLPPSLRFFAGGSQSVRGYGYKDLSPLDEEGNRIGGKYFAALGLEVDYLLNDTSGIAAFVDAGDATRDPIDTLKLGAGLGYRYRSPVGMFRIDVAHPLDDPDNSFRVHLSFGADL